MSAITPFRVEVPQADLDDLHDRLDRVRWPDELPGVGWGLGIPLERVGELATYRRVNVDWCGAEGPPNGARLPGTHGTPPRSPSTTPSSCPSARPTPPRCHWYSPPAGPVRSRSS